MDALSVPGVRIDPQRLTAFKALAAAHGMRRPARTAAMPGGLPSKKRGRGTDIEDVRPWSFGDDIRHIDRNATARTGIAHIRRFHDENETSTLLILDLRPSMLFGTRRVFRSVAAAEVLALAGWRAAAHGGRVALAAVGVGDPLLTPLRTGAKAMPDIVHAMARANDEALARPLAPDPPLDAILAPLLEHLPRGGEAVLATALETPGPGLSDTLELMRRKLRLTVVAIEDAFSRDRPAGLYPFLTLAGRKGVAAATAARAGGEPGQWAMALRNLGIAHVRLDTRLMPEDMLRTFEAAA